MAVQLVVTGSAGYEAREAARRAAREQEGNIRRTASRRSITTDNCTAAQEAELTKWDTDAWDKIQAARACTTSSCSTLVLLPLMPLRIPLRIPILICDSFTVSHYVISRCCSGKYVVRKRHFSVLAKLCHREIRHHVNKIFEYHLPM